MKKLWFLHSFQLNNYSFYTLSSEITGFFTRPSEITSAITKQASVKLKFHTFSGGYFTQDL